MKITNYGFIVKGSGYSPKRHTVTLESDSFKTIVVGVAGIDDAVEYEVKVQETQRKFLCRFVDQ
ncbi:hypothetical protein KKA47_07465 [bacterium]|nr:hypothetical protein [bacterium]